jgi:two-component system response regulator FixJ
LDSPFFLVTYHRWRGRRFQFIAGKYFHHVTVEDAMAKSKNRVCLVDDDAAFREAFRLAVKTAGFETVSYGSAQEFLAAFEPAKIFCLVLDIRLPGMSGLELQEILKARKTHIPILVLTGHGDIPMAVQAIKNGAMDFLEKPFKLDTLVERLHQAQDRYGQSQKLEQERQEIASRISRLTPRELQVFGLMADGMKNMAIAKHLGISRKTLDIHRTKVVEKMKARTWADLARWRMLHESGADGTVTLKPGSYIS